MATSAQTKMEKAREQLRNLAKEEVQRLSAERDAHAKKFEKLHARKDKLLEEIEEKKAEVKALMQQIREEDYVDRDRINNELSAASRDAGGRFLSDNPS